LLYVRKVLVVIKSGEKNKPMDQGGRGWWEERRKKTSENKPWRLFTNSDIRSRDFSQGSSIWNNLDLKHHFTINLKKI
jgi:hypothetical protein